MTNKLFINRSNSSQKVCPERTIWIQPLSPVTLRKHLQTLTTQDTFRKPFPATYCAFILSSNRQCFSKCMVRVGIAPHCSSSLENRKNPPGSENGICSWCPRGCVRVNHGLDFYQYFHLYNSTQLLYKTLGAIVYKNTTITNKQNIFLVRFLFSSEEYKLTHF